MESKRELESKKERTTHMQLMFFLQFAKEHQSILSRQKDNRAWAQLADGLNAMRGPTRTVSKWRQTLLHWRSQVRSRAKKLSIDPELLTPLSELECKALDTFGSSAANNLSELPTLGIQSFDDSDSTLIEPKQELLSPVEFDSEPPSPSTPLYSPDPTVPTTSKRKRPVDDEALSLLRESMKKTREYEERSLANQERSLEMQQEIASALNNITTALFLFIELKTKQNDE